MSSTFFRNEVSPILKGNEGGYVNDPDDPGGETNHGITERVARKYGYTGPMKTMTWQTAEDIYEKRYVIEPGFDVVARVAPKLAVKLCDIGVNQGIGKAAEFLQEGLNALNRGGQDYDDIKVDGDLGPRSFDALRKLLKVRGDMGMQALYGCVQAQQYVRYMQVAKANPALEKYMFGWFMRAGQ